MKKNLKRLTCLRCGWEWLKRVKEPRECPHCKSRYWRIAVEKKAV